MQSEEESRDVRPSAGVGGRRCHRQPQRPVHAVPSAAAMCAPHAARACLDSSVSVTGSCCCSARLGWARLSPAAPNQKRDERNMLPCRRRAVSVDWPVRSGCDAARVGFGPGRANARRRHACRDEASATCAGPSVGRGGRQEENV